MSHANKLQREGPSGPFSRVLWPFYDRRQWTYTLIQDRGCFRKPPIEVWWARRARRRAVEAAPSTEPR